MEPPVPKPPRRSLGKNELKTLRCLGRIVGNSFPTFMFNTYYEKIVALFNFKVLFGKNLRNGYKVNLPLGCLNLNFDHKSFRKLFLTHNTSPHSYSDPLCLKTLPSEEETNRETFISNRIHSLLQRVGTVRSVAVVKEEAKTISERQAIEEAILHAIARHRVSPNSILAVDVCETYGSYDVFLYLKGSPLVIIVNVEKSGKVFGSYIRSLWGE